MKSYKEMFKPMVECKDGCCAFCKLAKDKECTLDEYRHGPMRCYEARHLGAGEYAVAKFNGQIKDRFEVALEVINENGLAHELLERLLAQ